MNYLRRQTRVRSRRVTVYGLPLMAFGPTRRYFALKFTRSRQSPRVDPLVVILIERAQPGILSFIRRRRPSVIAEKGISFYRIIIRYFNMARYPVIQE